MSKTKKWLFAGGALLVIGVLIFACAMSALRWDFFRLDTAEYTAKTFTPDTENEAPEGVELHLESFPVIVKAGDSLSLDYYESSNTDVTVSYEGGVLKIRQRQDRWFAVGHWFHLGTIRYKYTLTVPNDLWLKIEGSNSDITMTDVATKDITVRTSNTDVTLRGCTVGALDIDGSNADVALFDSTAKNTKIYSSNLNLEIRNCTFDSLETKGSNCDVDMYDTASPVIHMSGSNGDFTCKRITVDNFSLHSSNLDADILICGVKEEYTVEASGRGLPNAQTGTTDKKIKISGTNCDVDLRWQ